MENLLAKIRKCEICSECLPLKPLPIIEVSKNSKIILVSQAPGKVAHNQNKAWMDLSRKKLREWLGVDEETFYDSKNFAILPMGFCYPGKGKTGDLPPMKVCAPMWHNQVFSHLKNVKLILLIGSYSSSYYLPSDKRNLTEKISNYEDYLPKFWPLPHPSPVNHFWRRKNPWFEDHLVPRLQEHIQEILAA